jgi:predicted transcriptional regulator
MEPSVSDFLQLPLPTGPVKTARPFHGELPHVKASDPATRVMDDFAREPPRTIQEDTTLHQAMDEMECLGLRELLVARDNQVVGLITAEDIKDQARQQGRAKTLRAADVMSVASEVPMIDWATLQDSTISDLVEIFDGTRVLYLLVVESNGISSTRVRGLIDRARLDRQLASLHS